MPCSMRNELFISGMTKTHVFRKQTIQDQIVSLSKLVSMFEQDYGYMPKHPTKVLVQLNQKLNRDILVSMNLK